MSNPAASMLDGLISMKDEDDTSSPPLPSTPKPAYNIDPALQQQMASAATPYQYQQYYPQATYGGYNPYAAQPQPQPQPQQAQQAPALTPTPAARAAQSTAGETIRNLNDALGSAGVDLRAEEESLQRSHDNHTSYRTFEDRTRKQPPKPNFETRHIGPTMRSIGTQHKVPTIPEDAVNYMALALRTRLQELLTAMIAAANHRTDEQFDRPASHFLDGTDSPMWGILVRSDVAKQLAAIEKVEREEEFKVRRERKERTDMAAAHAAVLAAQANGSGAPSSDGYDDMDGGAKKKRKKEGPGVTARNMSEDVRKKMSNAVASQAAGLGGKYAWMNAANASGTPSRPKPATTASTTSTPSATPSTGGGGWARPYQATKPTATAATPAPVTEQDNRMAVTIRDAMFVIEKERGHGGGRGAARGWT
ncbi:transcription initiation factor TFIID component TAF4 family-domain-containing protein [Mycena floridula]|nr:transcription initiation factor TFIID component TAF4 family-domain-containing protein [Mycena floridula]